MVYYLCDDMGIWLPRGITPIIQRVQARGYESVSLHRIQVPISILECYLLLCLIIHPDWDLEIVTNSLNGI